MKGDSSLYPETNFSAILSSAVCNIVLIAHNHCCDMISSFISECENHKLIFQTSIVIEKRTLDRTVKIARDNQLTVFKLEVLLYQ